MWNTINKVDILTQMEDCYNELMGQCKYSQPGAKLSLSLRILLERFSDNERQEIVNRVQMGCTPLFVACRKGKSEIVEYLLNVCHADIEQQGLYNVPDDKTSHEVTPLWCAAVAGKLSVVKCLLDCGANINSVSDTGSTPVRSACFMTHFDVVKLLVETGADINKSNYNGGTCLINSVQSAALCEFLLDNGANVNARDIQDKTALHYAIQEHRLETVQLLIERGADYNAQSRYGDDALQTACIKGALNVFEYLIHSPMFKYSNEKLANSYELMGATCLIDYNDVFGAINHWRQAISIREGVLGLLPKTPIMPPIAAFRYQKEFESMTDLENVITDLDSIRIQSLLITERILGSFHKDFILRLMLRGASYVDVLRYQRCIDLWRRALEVRIQKDTILYTDTCFSAHAVVQLMIYFNARPNDAGENNVEKRFEDALAVFRVLTEGIVEVQQLVTIKPMHDTQAGNFDKTLQCIPHLIYLMIEIAQTQEHVNLVKQLTVHLLRLNITSLSSEDTLLHLCVAKSNTLPSGNFTDTAPLYFFPKLELIKFLLDCGARINVTNKYKCTPLNAATALDDFDISVVKLLLNYGAHIDQPDSFERSPLNKILNNAVNTNIQCLNYLTLKCFCATVISKNKIYYKNQVPKSVEEFIKQHSP